MALTKARCSHLLGAVNHNCFDCNSRLIPHVKIHKEALKCGFCDSELNILRYNKKTHSYCLKCLGYRIGQKKAKPDPKEILRNLLEQAEQYARRNARW